jgi:mannuronan synthase
VQDVSHSADFRTPVSPPGRALRRGMAWPWQLLALGLLAGCIAMLANLVQGVGSWATERVFAIVFVSSGFATWRWGWFTLHTLRAICYRYWVFPRIRRKCLAAMHERGPVPEVTILVTTFRERSWITAAVFGSIYRELSRLAGLTRPPRVIAVAGCDQDDAQILSAHEECRINLIPADPENWPPQLVVARGDSGKRSAIATGLRLLAEDNPRDDGVVLFMDGDTLMGRGLLGKLLPVFRVDPPVAAATTNEDALVQGPDWFAEWLSLRFGQRHWSMCSHSLSDRVLCLTGRLSAFRASIAKDPGFVNQIENDFIDHWLWGRYQLMSGDDKSTWYWIASRGERMLYVPDAMATTIEVVEGQAVKRALANLRRWSGNTLRFNGRAMALGPGKLGWFPWWCTVDQRLSVWTVQIGMAILLLSACLGYYQITAGYLLWVILARTGRVAIAWIHGRRISAMYIPLQIISEWVGALMKTWIWFFPAKQTWFNRGGRTIDSTGGTRWRPLRFAVAAYLYAFSVILFVTSVATYTGFLPLLSEAPLFLRTETRAMTSPRRSIDSDFSHSPLNRLQFEEN